MGKKKIVKKEVEKVKKEIPYKAHVGRVMNETGIVGDGALVKKAE